MISKLTITAALAAAAALPIGVGLFQSVPAPAPAPATLRPAVPAGGALDYLVQDVCVDGDGRAVAQDPASCQRRRNLALGEPLPYIVTDFDHVAGISHASMSSIPVRAADGHVKVLVTKSLEGRYTPSYRFSFRTDRDAFDFIDVDHSRYASVVRTYDGGCFDQLFFANPSSRSMDDRAGGWILFPVDTDPARWPAVASTPLTTHRKQVSVQKEGCADNRGDGVTFWYRPASYRFETGKTLAAIRSDHFAAASLSDPVNSFERFFFTREYGMTRWESWRTLAECRRGQGAAAPICDPASPAYPARGRCSLLGTPGQVSPGVEVHGGQRWVRMDCRDMTRFVPLEVPQLPLSPEIATGGGLRDIDHDATRAGR